MRPEQRRELREWMGMTWADLCVYLAFASLAGMFVVRTAAIDIALALSAIMFAIASCIWV